jgi:hypothetical protein
MRNYLKLDGVIDFNRDIPEGLEVQFTDALIELVELYNADAFLVCKPLSEDELNEEK